MLKIKNTDVVKTYELLVNLTLPFKDSRLRSKFCRLLITHHDETYREAKQEIINHFSIPTEDGKFMIPYDKVGAYENEMKILENEHFAVELNELNKEMLLKINEILHDERLFDKLSGKDALVHDTLCDEFERIEEIYILNN